MAATYDAAEIARLDDPYPRYAALREAGRVVRGGPGTWAVTRYADVAALLADPRLGHEFPDAVYRFSGEPDVLTGFFRAAVLNRDPPSHPVLRRAMARVLAPRVVAALRPRIVALVGELFAGMVERGVADVVSELAYPLPVTVASELLGIPTAERAAAQPHAVALGRTFGAGLQSTPDRSEAVTALGWLRGFVDDLLRGRRADRGDDALAQLVAAAQASGELTREELVDNLIFLFFAGFETTTNLITAGCAALVQHPAVLRRLRAEPALAGPAVDEFLRFDAPIQATSRVTRAPVEVDRRLIRKDRVVVLVLGSANRDERQFHQPDEIDIGRSPNPHLGFSSGAHHCLGATLARLEGAAVFGHVARHLSVFEAAGDPVRRKDTSFRGYASIPVGLA